MLLRKVVAVAMAVAVMAAATVEVVTEVEGIFTAAAMAGDISAVGISVAVDATSAVAVTSAADRLRGRVFAATVLSRSKTPDRRPCGR
jgi:hypothetical protein